MLNDEWKLIYSVTFDETKFTSHEAISFKSGYSAFDGYVITDFLSGMQLPAGTSIQLIQNVRF